MRTISNLRGVRQILRIESAHVAIDESRVMEGTFTFDSTMVEGSVFQIGTAVADEINVTVVDPNGELNTYIDETYSIYIAPFNADRSQATWTLIGQYVVAELDTSYSGRAKVKFQDRMVTLDVPVDFQSGTLYANLQNLGLTLSLTQEEVTFLSGLSVLNRQTMTKRDFIRGCALLMWENAYLKPDGSLAFRSITTTAQTFTPSDRFSSELGDEVTIGPVRVIDDSGAVIYTMGSASGQTIEISSTTSPMISLIGSIEGLATYYSTATIPGRGIADFSYTPLTMSLLSTWALEPGDVVSYIDKDNNTYTSVVTSVAHVLNGASACTSAGEAKTRQSQQIPKQTDETRVVISQLESGIDTAQSTASEAMPKYGVCSTSASTATKEVDVGDGFVLREGARVAVLMQNSNTSTGTLKLKVNTSTAKNIVDSEGNALGMINGQTTSWLAGSMVTFVYTRNKTNTDYVWRVDDNFALTRINNILTDNIVGTNGWINLKDGKFNFGSGKLVWDVPSGGSTPTLTVTGDIVGSTITGSTITGGKIDISAYTNTFEHHIYSDDTNGKLIIGGVQVGGSQMNNQADLRLDPIAGKANLMGTDTVTIEGGGKTITVGGSYAINTTGVIRTTSYITATSSISTSGTITSVGAVQVGDKRSWTDANSGVYITPQGYISMRAQDGNSPGIFATAYGSTTTTYDAGIYYNATNDRWQSNKQIYAPSFYATGTITVERSDTTAVAQRVSNSVGNIALYVPSSGNRGVYDNTDNEWLFYKQASDGQRLPVATTAKNGFMSVADKTKLDGVATGAGRLRRVSVTSSSFTAAASGAGNITLTPTIPSGYSLVGVVLATTNNTNVGIVRTNSTSGNTAVEVRYKNFATTQQTGVTITVSVLLSNGVDLA